MRKTVSVFVAVLVLCVSFCVVASAQTYDTEYPNVFNSGSPLWFQCTVEGKGEFVILIDPNTNPQAFGFDKPNAYNLINNTGSTINGRAYKLDDNTGYIVRFPSYYCMQFREPGSGVAYTWEDVYITNISGSTLDFVDYHGTRGNDLYKNDIPDRQVNIIVCALLLAVVLLLVISLVFKPKLFRM